MIKAAIITLSDKGAAGQRQDTSADVIKEMLGQAGIETHYYELIPDEKDILREQLLKYAMLADLVITTGGTGLGPRDITPEVTREILEKEIPGIPEAIRAHGLLKTKRAMLSRAVAGTRGCCLIINLPGSPTAVREGLEAVLDVIPHAVEKAGGSGEDCAA
ncbi:MAG: MogA/MoaB family molybdenum cofactor biosynthesis protein [Nitrospiraceae bacterium]|nr:MogA/MoaB family molybdenum cofactor biosynthesis protein [Nitrospiraceae bacterium]